jgi:hypothetical protein
VQEEKAVGTEPTATSAVVNPASIAFDDVDNAHAGMKNDNSDDQGLNEKAGSGNGNGGGTDEP